MLTQQAKDLFGLELTPEQASQFNLYEQELIIWNSHTNLTAIAEPEAIRVRHFLDSLSVAQVVQFAPGMRVIDIGTGAGFPGLALHIIFPSIMSALLEATGKKINFLNHVIQTLGLTGVTAVNARAEDAGNHPDHRNKYDVVLARAVARLPALLEYMLPFAKVGGVCVAMKGETAYQEAEDSKKALQTLGGTLREIQKVQLPGVTEAHYLIVVEKTHKTPPAYPRKPGIPTRKPIE